MCADSDSQQSFPAEDAAVPSPRVTLRELPVAAEGDKRSMTATIAIGMFILIAVLGNLLATYQIRDRLDRIADILEKK